MAPTNASEVLEFVVVVGALQLSYLIWGVMQETIMHTGTYVLFRLFRNTYRLNAIRFVMHFSELTVSLPMQTYLQSSCLPL